jgi:heme-degrading monooxygenase HmoA
MKREPNGIILINTFFVNDFSKQQQIVDKLEDATKQIINKHNGFLSSRIYKSVEGTKVMSHVRWENKEAFEKMLNDPRFIIHMNDIAKLAKVDRTLYELVDAEEKGTE